MNLGGHYVGRNPRNAPGDDSSSSDGEGEGAYVTVAGGRKARIAAAKGHKAEHYRTRAEEEAALQRHLDELQAEVVAAKQQDGDDEDDEDAALDAELDRFRRRLAAAATQGAGRSANPALERVAAAAVKQTPKEAAAAKAARALRAAGTTFPIQWTYSGVGNGSPSVADAEVKVKQLERALEKPFPATGNPIALLLWHAALRPPWPLLGGVWRNLKPSPLSRLCQALDEHFGTRAAGLLPLDAEQQRVALLATWLVQDCTRGLAFVLAPVNDAAKDLSRLPQGAQGAQGAQVAVISLGDMTREAQDTSTWAYVGALTIPVCLIEAARGPTLF
jgi:hypothetical protein